MGENIATSSDYISTSINLTRGACFQGYTHIDAYVCKPVTHNVCECVCEYVCVCVCIYIQDERVAL